MNTRPYFTYLIIMMAVTYLIRALPFTLCRGEIKNEFIKNFLDYMPYTVLTAMTFPSMLFATGSTVSGIGAFITAFLLAYKKKSLIVVALFSSLVAYILLLAVR